MAKTTAPIAADHREADPAATSSAMSRRRPSASRTPYSLSPDGSEAGVGEDHRDAEQRADDDVAAVVRDAQMPREERYRDEPESESRDVARGSRGGAADDASSGLRAVEDVLGRAARSTGSPLPVTRASARDMRSCVT